MYYLTYELIQISFCVSGVDWIFITRYRRNQFKPKLDEPDTQWGRYDIIKMLI